MGSPRGPCCSRHSSARPAFSSPPWTALPPSCPCEWLRGAPVHGAGGADEAGRTPRDPARPSREWWLQLGGPPGSSPALTGVVATAGRTPGIRPGPHGGGGHSWEDLRDSALMLPLVPQVFPHVLHVREPGLRPADPAPHAQLAPALQVLPLVSMRSCSCHPRGVLGAALPGPQPSFLDRGSPSPGHPRPSWTSRSPAPGPPRPSWTRGLPALGTPALPGPAVPQPRGPPALPGPGVSQPWGPPPFLDRPFPSPGAPPPFLDRGSPSPGAPHHSWTGRSPAPRPLQPSGRPGWTCLGRHQGSGPSAGVGQACRAAAPALAGVWVASVAPLLPLGRCPSWA